VASELQEDDELLSLSQEEIEKRLRKVEAGIRKSEKATKFARYEPVEFQRTWFDTFASRVFKTLVWICGNRTGKSETAAILMISSCLGVLPESLGGEIPRRWSDLAGTREGLKFLAMCPTIRQSGKLNIAKKLRTYITADMLSGPPKRDEDGNDIEWNFVTGATLTLQSYKSPPDSVEGIDWDGIWFDEPPPRKTYVGVVRGTADRGGFVLVTATPVGENSSWFNADLIEPAENEECIECNKGLGSISHAEAVEQSPAHGFVKIFKAELHDNCAGGAGLDGTVCQGNGGYIPHKEIEILRATWTPQERLIREFGDLTAITDIEFPYVSEQTHVVKDINPVELGLPIVEIVDPAPKRGLHVKWYTVTSSNLWYCFMAARVSAARGYRGMAEEVKRYRKQIGRAEPDIALLDPRGGAAPTITVERQSTWFEEFRKQGLVYKPAIGMGRKEGDSGEQTSIEVLHDWLKAQFNPATEGQDVPKLRFCQRVKFIDEGPLWAYRKFSWDHQASNRKKRSQPGKDWVDLDAYLALYVNQHKLTYEKLARRLAPPAARPSLAETYASVPKPLRHMRHQFQHRMGPTGGRSRGEIWRRVS
jgi:phage terminase large subunit-like protein